ncbi:MAG: hypothetical protein WDZ79_00460 [Candidatus Paceibacterota bacterium]
MYPGLGTRSWTEEGPLGDPAFGEEGVDDALSDLLDESPDWPGPTSREQ